MVKDIAHRLLVVIDDEHYNANSFISLGPIRALENAHGDTSICVLNRFDIGIKSIRDVTAVKSDILSEQLAQAINARGATSKERSTFNSKRPGHIIKLIVGLIQHYGALTLDEIETHLFCIGQITARPDIENYLLCAEFADWIIKDKRGRQLAIGAPSSPVLSNILMFEFDTLISAIAAEENAIYTRYADDLTFSAARSWNLKSIEMRVQTTLRKIQYPKLTIHPNKTTHVTKKFSRTITGLILANDGTVTLGKDRKRRLHAATHAASKEELSAKEMQKLAGMLAFVNSVEPAFLKVLARRYGDTIILHLQRVVAKDRTKYQD